jgi:hypothetical protein
VTSINIASPPMRKRVPALLLVLAACVAPTGAERPGCNADWLDLPAVIAEPVGVRERPISIDCIGQIEDRRLRVGFFLPAGPDCYVLQRVDLAESADAVSITLIVAVNDDPSAGACPEERQRVITEIDLAAPLDDRVLLDGASQPVAAGPMRWGLSRLSSFRQPSEYRRRSHPSL